MTTSSTDGFPLAGDEEWLGDAGGTTAPGVGGGVEAGASGEDSYSTMSIPIGGLIAIIVVVVAVAVLGASTAVLFYVAKKREWTVKETLRRSARKVVTALTPRRTEFPDSVKNFNSSSSRRARARLADDIPPTPRLRPEDLEKGRMNAESQSKKYKWGR